MGRDGKSFTAIPFKKSDSAIVVIGGGPAGLMSAEVIARAGYSVEIYDAMPSVGRKFLLAGVGGMNITHAESPEKFLSRYGDAIEWLKLSLENFGSKELREWVHGLGIETFVGTSGRVFPAEMKAAPLLRAWLHRLRQFDVKIFSRHRWLGWNQNNELVFETENEGVRKEKVIKPLACVLALGGASWSRLGSNGVWVNYLHSKKVSVTELKPSNSGFDVAWSEKFKKSFAGVQLSTISLSVPAKGVDEAWLRSEAIVTQYGIEGTGVYALSQFLREQILQTGSANLYIDLLPDWSLEKIQAALAKPKGKNSFSNFLRKQLNLSPVKLGLLYECVSKDEMLNLDLLATQMKSLALTLSGIRPIDEAISSAGGVSFTELSSDLMLHKLPGVFCAGEMLDWEAPTGGYLLTGCFSTGARAGEGVVTYLNKIQ